MNKYIILLVFITTISFKHNSQISKSIKDSLILNYIGYNLLNCNKMFIPEKIGRNIIEVLSNEKYHFDFTLQIEPKSEFNFSEYKFFSYKNLGVYSYCERPCDFENDTVFDKYIISTGKLFKSDFKSKTGLIAIDTISNKIYFVSGHDIKLDLDFYSKLKDKKKKISIFTFSFEAEYKKKRFSKYYIVRDYKIYLRKGIPRYKSRN